MPRLARRGEYRDTLDLLAWHLIKGGVIGHAMSIKREHYRIDEAARIIGCTVNDLIHLGGNWWPDIHVRFKHDVTFWPINENHIAKKSEEFIEGLFTLTPYDLKELEAEKEFWLTTVLYGSNGYKLEYPLSSKSVTMFIKTKDIERLKADAASNSPRALSEPPGDAPSQATGISVNLPHMTKALEAVFAVMRDNWTNHDPKRLPKQINIAREIDAALGWGKKGDPGSEPSRDAKTLAKIIKPDSIGTDEVDTE